jgi:hypothetical protein
VKWKDAGKALNNEELLGCHMPEGPGADVSPNMAYLQYNEVSLLTDDHLNHYSYCTAI